MNKKKIICLISLILIVLIVVIVVLLKKEKPIPFVEKYNIEILEPKEYSSPVYLFAVDLRNNYLDDDFKFNDSNSTFNFYDLKIENHDDYDIYTFKVDSTVPVEYKTTYEGKYTYSYSSVEPVMFDYYTGEEYKKGIIATNKVVGIDVSSSNNEMQYTTIKWNGKKYEIGILAKYISEWDGNVLNMENETYSDTSRTLTLYTIKVPKDYDGLMMAILKKGSTKESFKLYNERYERYLKLKDEEQETGKKSKELIEMEKDNSRIIKLFDSKNDKNKKYTKDDFYVFRVNDILKEEEI